MTARKGRPAGKEWTPAPMVGWYDPKQLLRTGVKVLVSKLFAENADGRLLQPLLDEQHKPGEPPRWNQPGGLWIDYVSDTGEGFTSTYAVARTISQKELALEGSAEVFPRAGLVILGGDQVYPSASAAEYERRLCKPFEMAFPAPKTEVTAKPSMYAIPGNHDWYDNLAAFTSVFLVGKDLGGWALPQRRSYFALELPSKWWLLAVDVQLGSDIDPTQYEFFVDLAEKFVGGERVILCTPEPHWVYENEARCDGSEQRGRGPLLQELERKIHEPEGRIRMIVAGDLHHYRRHSGRIGEHARDVHLVTAGGGGAFLHPTHGWRDETEDTKNGAHYKLKKSYPERKVSRGLSRWLTFTFPWKNAWFMAASAPMCGIVAGAVVLTARDFAFQGGASNGSLALAACTSANVVTWWLLIIAGFLAFTDSSLRFFRWTAGGLHGLVQASAAVAIPGYAVATLGPSLCPAAAADAASWIRFLIGLGTYVGVSLAGGLLSAFVMGFYLTVSLDVFRRHRNETFSALRMEKFKSFLRLHIDESGKLAVHAIGIDEPASKKSGAKLVESFEVGDA